MKALPPGAKSFDSCALGGGRSGPKALNPICGGTGGQRPHLLLSAAAPPIRRGNRNRSDGHFFDVSSRAGTGIQAGHSSRGIAVADLDNDGSVEIVVVNMHERASLLENTVRSGNSVLIQALTASGRDAVGARITLRTNGARQADEIGSGGYYISQGDFRLHFGMRAETKAMLSVRWPCGKAKAL